MLRTIIFGFLFTMGIYSISHAQDGHYWSENYGNKSMLLSGTVNASVEDLGAVFYNPARLGLIENPAFVISAKVYEWSKLKIEDGIDDGVDLAQDNFGGAPSLVAGTFKVPFLKGHRFAYSFLTRQRGNMDFYVRVEKEGDVTDYLPGNELFNGQLKFSSKFNDDWIGLTWSPPTTKKTSFGLSTFISGVNKNNKVAQAINAINMDNQAGHYSQNRVYNYESFGVLWKAGLAIDLDKINLGLTLTTPRIQVTGKGSTLFEEYLVGIDTTGDGENDNIFIYNTQEISNVSYKSPWAIGVGIGVPFNKGVVHISGEWYSSIPEYQIMQIEPFVGQSSGDTIDFALIDNLESTLNFGIGTEIHFNEKVSAYGSVASDFSAVPSEINRFSDLDNKANSSIFQLDFIQFGGGLSIKTKGIEITAGATYRGATQEFEQTLDFPPANEEKYAKLIYSQWRFILGFSFPFAEKLIEGEKEKD